MSRSVERYRRDGTVETGYTAEIPGAMPSVTERLAEIEATIEERVTARIAALEQRTTGLDVDSLKGKLASLEERVGRAVTRAASIDPDAVEEPGARAEFAKVKDALTPDVPANETEVV